MPRTPAGHTQFTISLPNHKGADPAVSVVNLDVGRHELGIFRGKAHCEKSHGHQCRSGETRGAVQKPTQAAPFVAQFAGLYGFAEGRLA